MAQRNLKVLMIGWELPPFNSGGLGVACYFLARGLKQKGIDIIFTLPKRLDIKINDFPILFASQELISQNQNAYITIPAQIERVSFYAWGFLIDVLNYAENLKKFAKLDFDLIHCHDWLSILGGIVLKRITGKPLIFQIHSTEYDRTGGNNPNPIIVKIEKMGIDNADKIVAVSNYLAKIIKEKYGADPKKIEIVHNGISSDFYQKVKKPSYIQKIKKERGKIISFVGRLTIQKGPDYFIETARLIRQFIKKAYFFIAGAGDMMNQIIRKSAEYGLAGQIRFAGFLRGEELKSFYQSSDLFIMPSVSDPFGIVALEAMASGVPTIVSKNSGVAEILFNVLKVDFWDIKETTNKAVAVLKYPALAHELSKNGQAEVSKMTWLKSADKLINTYQQF